MCGMCAAIAMKTSIRIVIRDRCICGSRVRPLELDDQLRIHRPHVCHVSNLFMLCSPIAGRRDEDAVTVGYAVLHKSKILILKGSCSVVVQCVVCIYLSKITA